jgi:hypothetical protein
MSTMQRLFGTFPNGSAGTALVVLRLAASVFLINQCRLCLLPGGQVLLALSGVAGLSLLAGLFTPAAAGMSIAISLCEFWLCGESAGGVLLIAILVAIALLGAGAYSLDARIFGRRKLIVVRSGNNGR